MGSENGKSTGAYEKMTPRAKVDNNNDYDDDDDDNNLVMMMIMIKRHK